MTPILIFWKDCKQNKIGTDDDFLCTHRPNVPNNTPIINGCANLLLFIDLAPALQFWYTLWWANLRVCKKQTTCN
jgi:hypothetical protein